MEKFLEGELIDLYIPDLDFIRSSKTFEWWNDPRVTRFLESGVRKNTLQKQEAYYQNTKDLVFFFSDKQNIVGTVVIAGIDEHRKCGELGIVRGNFDFKKPLQSLEAIAHLMDHVFQTLKLERIFARHHIGHIPFSHRLSLLGYQLEGIFTNDFIKEDWSEVSDRIHTVCHRATYEEIISTKGGGAYGIVRQKCSIASIISPKNHSIINFSPFLKPMLNITAGFLLFDFNHKAFKQPSLKLTRSSFLAILFS